MTAHLNYQIPTINEAASTWGAKVEDALQKIDDASFTSAQAYGADPTGVADSTAAIQAAIAFLGLVGGIVFFPFGEYRLMSSVVLAAGQSNLTFLGFGYNAERPRIVTSVAISMFDFNGTGASPNTHIRFTGLTLRHTGASGRAIDLVNATVYQLKIDGCSFQGDGGTPNYAVVSNNSSDIRHVSMSGCLFTGWGSASVSLGGYSAISIVNNKFLDETQVGVQFYASLAANEGDVSVGLNTFLVRNNAGAIGIDLQGDATNGSRFAIGLNNFIAAANGVGKGINIAAVNDVVRIGNTFPTSGNLLAVNVAGGPGGGTPAEFEQDGMRFGGGTRVTRILSNTGTFDFPSINAQTTSELDFALAGSAPGDDAVVTPSGAPESGLVWSGYVSAAGNVRIRVGNITSGAINPASRTWRVTVIQF